MGCDTLLINVEYSQIVVAELQQNQLCGVLVERLIQSEEQVLGNIYCGRVQNVVRGINAAFVDIGLHRTALLALDDVTIESMPNIKSRASSEIRSGDFVIVQVEKEPVDEKGARLTTQISLPGRYIVLNTSVTTGVSQKIKVQSDRKRLLSLIEENCPPQRGIVVRTAAQHASDAEILRDIEMLDAQMQHIEDDFSAAKSVRLLHRADGLLSRVARDMANADTKRIIVDAPYEYSLLRELLSAWSPQLVERVEFYDQTRWILDEFGVAHDFRAALQRKVALPSGGNLIIDEVESLTAIDVNTAQYVGKKKLAETVLQTNREAAQEIARHLRLRNLGGVIVVDFIDMTKETDRAQILSVLNETLKQDRAKTRLVHFSSLGLLQMTRERRGHSLKQLFQTKCPCCNGDGAIPDHSLRAIEAYHLLGSTLARRPDAAVFCIWLPVALAESFLGRNCDAVDQWQNRWQKKIRLAIFSSSQDASWAPRVEIIAPNAESFFPSVGTRFHSNLQNLYLINDDYFAIQNHRLVRLSHVPESAAQISLWIEIIAHSPWFCEGKILASGEPKTNGKSDNS